MRPRLAAAIIVLSALGACPGGRPAIAQTDAAPSGSDSLWTRQTLLGNLGGFDQAMARHGISLGLTETSEVLGNVTGGIHRGADYDGMTELNLTVDSDKAFGWTGGQFYGSALQIHGHGISGANLDELHTVSSIEASDTTRLWELWYDQTLGPADIKIGQQSIDQEFTVIPDASVFMNATLGWGVLPTADLYASGPVYPLSSLGVRGRVHVSSAVTVLGGVFDDNPPGGPFAMDSQRRGREAIGMQFNLGTGALWIGEVQYVTHQSPEKSCQTALCGLPGTFKVGAYYDSGSFPDQAMGADGLPLADPASGGVPRMHHGNEAVYALADQMLWRGGGNDKRSLSAFLRLTGAPADRNLVDFSVDAGLVLRAPFAGRDSDAAGIAFSYARIGTDTRQFDRDVAAFSGAPYPVRSNEGLIELTYQAQLTPWWMVQPDFQYVIRPGGGIPDPVAPDRTIGNEAVLGLRTVITFQ